MIVQRIYESDDKCRVLRRSLTQEKERVTGQNFVSSITDETHRCVIETGRSVMSVVWVEKPPSHQQGPGCYDAITCKGNELYLSWIGFCFMNIGKNKPVEKNLRSVRFVCLALIVHVHRIDTKISEIMSLINFTIRRLLYIIQKKMEEDVTH